MKRSPYAWLALFLKVILTAVASFYQVHASTCDAKEGAAGKNLIQSQSHTQRQAVPALQAGGRAVLSDDDALPPWALPRDSAGEVSAVEEGINNIESKGHAPERAALLETGQAHAGDSAAEDETRASSWLRRIHQAREAAERAHEAVQQARRRLAHAVRNPHEHVKHVSMLSHRGGPQVITMIYVMTVPVGIMSLGFGALMIARFADSTGDGNEEDESGPAAEEVLQGEPWRCDSSEGDGSLPPVGQLRVPHNSLPTVSLPPLEVRRGRDSSPRERDAKGLKKTLSEPDMKGSEGLKKTRSQPLMGPQADSNRLEMLHDDLQAALSAVKKDNVNVNAPHLNFRPFPEETPRWAPSKGKGASSSSGASTTVSETGSTESSRKASPENAHLQEEVIGLKKERSKDKDCDVTSQDGATKGEKTRSDRRKGHRARPPAEKADEADDDGISDGSATLSPPVQEERTATCRSSVRVGGLGMSEEKAVA